MALQTRKLVIITVLLCIFMFVIGILIGHFGIPKTDQNSSDDERNTGPCVNDDTDDYIKRYSQECTEQTCQAEATNCNADLPYTYIAYHLDNKVINIDGRLNDEAWTEVPWSQPLVDIRGGTYPNPSMSKGTRFKVRWDDARLYVGAILNETDIWATFTEDESLVWKDNAFEVYAVVDGSLHNYKEMQINALGTTWDLMLTKAYIDGGEPVGNWSSDMQKAVYSDGPVNNPDQTSTYWSVEWSFSFEALAEYSNRGTNYDPDIDEVWFMIFARPEWPFEIRNGQYYKIDGETKWWSWPATGTVNLHLPSRFGLVQFKRDMTDSTFSFPRWHVYKALFDVFEALHAYKAVNGMFIDTLEDLTVPPYLFSGNCVQKPTITLHNATEFEVVVESKQAIIPTGHIRTDRKVWLS